MQVSITSLKILGHYIHYLENPHLNYQHFRKSDRADALDPSIKQELSERSGETWVEIKEKLEYLMPYTPCWGKLEFAAWVQMRPPSEVSSISVPCVAPGNDGAAATPFAPSKKWTWES